MAVPIAKPASQRCRTALLALAAGSVAALVLLVVYMVSSGDTAPGIKLENDEASTRGISWISEMMADPCHEGSPRGAMEPRPIQVL